MSYKYNLMILESKARRVEKQIEILKYWESVSKKMKRKSYFCLDVLKRENFKIVFPHCTLIRKLEVNCGYKYAYSKLLHKIVKLPSLSIKRVIKRATDTYKDDEAKIYQLAGMNGLEICDEDILLNKSVYYFKKKDVVENVEKE